MGSQEPQKPGGVGLRPPPWPLVEEERRCQGSRSSRRGRKSLRMNYQPHLLVLWVSLAHSQGCALLVGWLGAGPSPHRVFHPPCRLGWASLSGDGGIQRGCTHVRACTRPPRLPVCWSRWPSRCNVGVGRRPEVKTPIVAGHRVPSAPCEAPVTWKTRPSAHLSRRHIQLPHIPPHTAAGDMEAASKEATCSYLTASD